MVCAGNTDDNHRNFCPGDSGGALACLQNNKMILTGIVSYGQRCAGTWIKNEINLKYSPNYYTRVSYYLDWINQYKVKS